MFPHPSYGGASFLPETVKIIRFVLMGCTNRPFFHIVVMEDKKSPNKHPVIEQLGTFDPLPNFNNEKCVGINFARLEYWLKEGVKVSPPVGKILGLAGFFPIHPESFLNAWHNKKKIANRIEKLKTAIENFDKDQK